MNHSTLPHPHALLSIGAACACALAFALAGCTQAPPTAASTAAPDAAPTAAAAQPAVAATPAAEVAPVAEPPAPVPQPVVHKSTVHKHVRHHAATSAREQVAASNANPEPTAAPLRQPIMVCTNCGVITAITPVKTQGKGTAIGIVAGGLAGLIVGNQIGGGNGKTIAKVAGAAGGALLGNKIEKRVRAETSYEVKIKLDDGTETTVTQETEPKLAFGAAVRIVDGNVVAR